MMIMKIVFEKRKKIAFDFSPDIAGIVLESGGTLGEPTPLY
jgi:hypothetical protein